MKTEKGRKTALKKLHAHPLHTAFESGIFSTMRTDGFTTGSVQENALIAHLRPMFKNEQSAQAAKTFLADTTTSIGTKLGEVYDLTEVIPKVMMYLSRKEHVGDQMAIQEVLMAFPTYNNMGSFFGAIDLFSPYTKYMLNYPKMLMYALSNNTVRLTAMTAITMAATRASYGNEVEDEDTWFYENDFIKLGDDTFKNTSSMQPYYLPLKGVTGTKLLDPLFVISGTQSVIDITDFLTPTTTRH
jgi:hypothetical protein